MPKQLIAVTCEESGHEALYADGILVYQDSTIYACDIAEHAKDGPINFSHVLVSMPESADRYPDRFEDCLAWVSSSS